LPFLKGGFQVPGKGAREIKGSLEKEKPHLLYGINPFTLGGKVPGRAATGEEGLSLFGVLKQPCSGKRARSQWCILLRGTQSAQDEARPILTHFGGLELTGGKGHHPRVIFPR